MGRGEQVLDVGCGTGSQTIMMALEYPGASFTGIDFSPGMIAMAEGKAPRGLDLRFRVAAVEDPPFADHSFDLVYSTLSFHHWRDRRLGVAQCARVLRPGGRLVIIDITGDRWYSRMYRLFGRFRHLTGHVPYARAAEISGLMRDEGLEAVYQEGIWPSIVLTAGSLAV